MTFDFDATAFSPSDLFLAPALSDQSVQRYLSSIGFRDPAAADQHLQVMADDYAVRQSLGSMAGSLMDSLRRAPDPDSALVGFERYLSTRTSKINFLNYLAEDIIALDLLVQVLGTSPFLSEILIRNPEYFHWLRHEYDRAPFDAAHYEEEISPLLETLQGAAAKLDALKRFKRRHLLRIAARDILGAETLPSATAQLSDLADAIVEKTCSVVGDQQAGKERGSSVATRKSSQKAGLRQHFCVVGMGKLGGRELNYSSDIDLIYVFDADAAAMQHVASRPRRKAHCSAGDGEEFFLKLARDLTRALTEYTSESYLYRIDLRLRPMGATGQIAYSIGQYRHYYETWGETFERFALIKARPIAGDLRLGGDFLAMVRAFVYRKYLDHAALEEIVRIKARADAASGDEELEQNVKTGRGGIREIELFTQILQLLYGGSQPELQNPNTLEALNKLLQARFISESVCEDLGQAYIFLRTVEHRLQIVQERQLHTLPVEKTEREICARRLGFASASELDAKLNLHRGRVHEIYEQLLHDKARGAGGPSRRFVAMLAGEIPDAEVAKVLGAYGFKDPAAILTVIQSLDNVPSLAHSRSATRNLLSNLLPSLLEEAAVCAEPEKVLNRLEQLASKTGAGSSLFLSLLENELLRHELIRVLNSGELLAQRLIRYPELLDSLMINAQSPRARRRSSRTTRKDSSRFAPGRSGAPEASWSAAFDQLKRRDDLLDELRRFKSVEEFKILVSWLRNGSLEECQEQLSRLAQFCVTRVAKWHAAPVAPAGRAGAQSGWAGAEWAIFGLGKLGSGELTVHSDLDLVFFYRGDPADSNTFMKHQNFVQAVQHALEEPTSHGAVYKIDTRLRPEGNKGAPAMPVATFKRYLQTRAGKWERLAWTRSRFLAGSKRLAAEISRTANSFVYGSWDSGLPKYMDNVRSRMEAELSREAGGDQFDFKVGYGALADIDFLLQMIQIREGERNLAFRLQGARRLLAALKQAKLETRIISKQDINTLLHSYSFLRHVEIMARMESDSNINWIPKNPELLNALGRSLRMPAPPGRNLLRDYKQTTKQIRAIYRKTLRRLAK